MEHINTKDLESLLESSADLDEFKARLEIVRRVHKEGIQVGHTFWLAQSGDTRPYLYNMEVVSIEIGKSNAVYRCREVSGDYTESFYLRGSAVATNPMKMSYGEAVKKYMSIYDQKMGYAKEKMREAQAWIDELESGRNKDLSREES